MGYQVRATKIKPGKYQLSYGRGARRVTAKVEQVANRKWAIDVLPDRTPPSMAVAKMEFSIWAIARYGGHGAPTTPAAVARLLNPLAGPSDVAQAQEPAAPFIPTLSLDLGADSDPIREFLPGNDFERGLLAAARCVTSWQAFPMTRVRLAEKILELGVLDRTPAELLAREIREILLAKPAHKRHAAREVAHV